MIEKKEAHSLNGKKDNAKDTQDNFDACPVTLLHASLENGCYILTYQREDDYKGIRVVEVSLSSFMENAKYIVNKSMAGIASIITKKPTQQISTPTTVPLGSVKITCSDSDTLLPNIDFGLLDELKNASIYGWKSHLRFKLAEKAHSPQLITDAKIDLASAHEIFPVNSFKRQAFILSTLPKLELIKKKEIAKSDNIKTLRGITQSTVAHQLLPMNPIWKNFMTQTVNPALRQLEQEVTKLKAAPVDFEHTCEMDFAQDIEAHAKKQDQYREKVNKSKKRTD